MEQTQITPQGLILYRQLLDDAKITKRQQWATANYAALIYAAIIYLHDKISKAAGTSFLLSMTAVVTALVAIVLLIWFQRDLYKIRKRIEIVNQYCFVGAERSGLDIKADRHPFGRGWHILAALIFVCAVGAWLVFLAVAKW